MRDARQLLSVRFAGRFALVMLVSVVVASCSNGDLSDAAEEARNNAATTVEADAATETSPAVTTAPPPATTNSPRTQPPASPETSVETTTSAPPEPAPTAPTTTTSPAPTTPIDATCPPTSGLLPADGEPVSVILDTDFAGDVDDAGALAVLHVLADAGDVEILAVMVSDGGPAQSHRAIDAINTYYGRPDIPIGVVSGVAPQAGSSYVDALATGFANDIEDPPAATDLYREILSGQPDDSVTVVSVGYLTNLEALLSSPPDDRSDSSGDELVDAKVKRWVAMGGAYPDSLIHPFGAEFNFVEDATATLNAVEAWPTPALFSGWEVGDAVLTGAVLQTETPPENPVREAYRLFTGGQNRHSWDLTAVLVAVRGTAGVFEVCGGRNVIGAGGSNTWELDPGGPHGYLRLTVPGQDVAAVLDDLLITPPTGL